MTLRQDVMALPAEDRLDYALDLLDEFTGEKFSRAVEEIRLRFRLSPRETQLFSILHRRLGQVVHYEILESSLDFYRRRTFAVWVSLIRKKGIPIRNVDSVGYILPVDWDPEGLF